MTTTDRPVAERVAITCEACRFGDHAHCPLELAVSSGCFAGVHRCACTGQGHPRPTTVEEARRALRQIVAVVTRRSARAALRRAVGGGSGRVYFRPGDLREMAESFLTLGRGGLRLLEPAERAVVLRLLELLETAATSQHPEAWEAAGVAAALMLEKRPGSSS